MPGRFFVILLGLWAGGCASRYLASAEREGNAIAAEKMVLVEEFRRDLVDPTREVRERTKQAPPVEVPEQMALDDALRIATRHNRDYLNRRESYFLAALGLSLTRRNFLRPVFDGSISWSGSDGRNVELSESTLLALSGTQLLPTGGRVTVSPSASLGTGPSGAGGRVQDADISGSVTVTQPLLAGAGRRIAFEALTQAERDVVYEARSFEEFRQTFAVGIINTFFSLISQKQGIVNTKARVEGQEFAVQQAKALYDLQQGPLVDVFRAQQTYRRARNDLLDAEQRYQLSLDRFKIDLGLPLDVEFDVTGEIPAFADFDLDMKAAVGASLQNRLDLATQRDRVADAERDVAIARNALLPDLSLDATYSIFSGDMNSFRDAVFDSDTATFGLTLEIPFDRKAQRNSYQSSIIDLARTHRARRDREDEVIVQVRDSLRSLSRLKGQIELRREDIKTGERNHRKAILDNKAGEASNRDIVEALDQLTDDRNSLLDLRVAYHVTRLTLLQQMGLLFVDKQGRIVS